MREREGGKKVGWEGGSHPQQEQVDRAVGR